MLLHKWQPIQQNIDHILQPYNDHNGVLLSAENDEYHELMMMLILIMYIISISITAVHSQKLYARHSKRLEFIFMIIFTLWPFINTPLSYHCKVKVFTQHSLFGAPCVAMATTVFMDVKDTSMYSVSLCCAGIQQEFLFSRAPHASNPAFIVEAVMLLSGIAPLSIPRACSSD